MKNSEYLAWIAAAVGCVAVGLYLSEALALAGGAGVFWVLLNHLYAARERNKTLEAMIGEALTDVQQGKLALNRVMSFADGMLRNNPDTMSAEMDALALRQIAKGIPPQKERRQTLATDLTSKPPEDVAVEKLMRDVSRDIVVHEQKKKFQSWSDALGACISASGTVQIGFPKVSELERETESADDVKVDPDHPAYGVLCAHGEYGPHGPMYGELVALRHPEWVTGNDEPTLYFILFRRTRQKLAIEEAGGREHYVYEFYKAWRSPTTID